MNKTVRATIAAMALVAAPGIASAADLPVKAPGRIYAPEVFSWSGFYLGVNAGWGWSSGSGTIAFGPFSGPVSGNGNGFLGGVQAGYNWQFNSIVFGLEADAQYTASRGDFNGTAGPITLTSTAKVPWFGTGRARLGYAFDRSMLYVTGGAAFGQGKLEGTLSTTGPFTVTRDFVTWTAGGGLETMLWDRWSAKLEYLYISTPNHFPMPPGATDISGSQHTHIGRVGLNYHF